LKGISKALSMNKFLVYCAVALIFVAAAADSVGSHYSEIQGKEYLAKRGELNEKVWNVINGAIRNKTNTERGHNNRTFKNWY